MSNGPSTGGRSRDQVSGDAVRTRRHLPITDAELIERSVTGLPRWRRSSARRELAAYLEDAYTDLLDEGLDAVDARRAVRTRFGDPERVASGFRAVPPPRWARGMRRGAGPISAAVLGLVLGLALIQIRGQASGRSLARGDGAPDSAQLALLPVREVDDLEHAAAQSASSAQAYDVATRLGVVPSSDQVLEPSLPALTPNWLPNGYDPDQSALFLSGSATVQFFANARGNRPGIVVEVLRSDRSAVFQVKERHVFPVLIGSSAGYYIDGEWEVRGPVGEQAAPATWRTDLSHSLLFARDGLLILVAGPADTLDVDTLVRIARSIP